MSHTRAVLDAVQSVSQYDENAKMLLADKEILANILVRTVNEFSEMEPEEVKQLIEGEPSIGSTPAGTGLTNEETEDGDTVICRRDAGQNHSAITGMNTENKVRNEGVVYFDILFYVQTVNGLSKVIINVEAQKKEPTEYDVEMRGIFYASRELASQLHREFSNQRYNEIKKVYSIWIVMNTREDTIDRIHLHKEDVLGSSRWKPMYDILNVVIIRMKNVLIADKERKHELHRLLGALFAEDISLEERSDVLEEFGIGMQEKRKEMVKSMCNLGEGIWERGVEHGIEQGMEQGRTDKALEIAAALLDIMDVSTIAQKTGLTEVEVQSLAGELGVVRN